MNNKRQWDIADSVSLHIFSELFKNEKFKQAWRELPRDELVKIYSRCLAFIDAGIKLALAS